MEMTGAQILVQALLREKVERVFGYAGATICPAVDVLRATPQIGYTLVRTEQNAGHMASGYARVTGKVGVCMVTSGPGATNLITGIATAYMDSIPMVAITGQVPSHLLGRDIFQEVDITGAVTPFTKHTYLVKDAAQLPRIVKEAFYIASTGRPGPVLIDIPSDIQEQVVQDVQFPEHAIIRGYNPSVRGNDKQIGNVAEAISKAQRRRPHPGKHSDRLSGHGCQGDGYDPHHHDHGDLRHPRPGKRFRGHDAFVQYSGSGPHRCHRAAERAR